MLFWGLVVRYCWNNGGGWAGTDFYLMLLLLFTVRMVHQGVHSLVIVDVVSRNTKPTITNDCTPW